MLSKAEDFASKFWKKKMSLEPNTSYHLCQIQDKSIVLPSLYCFWLVIFDQICVQDDHHNFLQDQLHRQDELHRRGELSPQDQFHRELRRQD